MRVLWQLANILYLLQKRPNLQWAIPQLGQQIQEEQIPEDQERRHPHYLRRYQEELSDMVCQQPVRWVLNYQREQQGMVSLRADDKQGRSGEICRLILIE